MEIKKEINITEILLASLIAFLTILTTFYIYIDYIIKREPHFSSDAVNSLFFLIYNARVTFLISTVFFIIIAILSTVYYLKKSDPEPSKVGNFSKVPIAQGFLFLFLLLSFPVHMLLDSYPVSSLTLKHPLQHVPTVWIALVRPAEMQDPVSNLHLSMGQMMQETDSRIQENLRISFSLEVFVHTAIQ